MLTLRGLRGKKSEIKQDTNQNCRKYVMKNNVGQKFAGSNYVGLSAAAILAAVILAGSSFAQAQPLPPNQITTAPGFGPWIEGSGGEFTVIGSPGIAALLGGYSAYTVNQGGYQNSFQTFCVERNENISANTTYDVTFNNITVFSGVPLSRGAAYLYEQFATGNLMYSYDNVTLGSRLTSQYSAYNLQRAISYFMGEYGTPGSYPGFNPYLAIADAALGGDPAAFLPDNGAHGVSVLNLWAPGQPHDPAHSYQDVMIYTGVPEPSALTLGFAFMGALLAMRRRK